MGPEHPETGTSLSNLALLYKTMGAYDKALPLYKRALAIAEKAQGPKHPSTGTRLNNLAALHQAMGAYDKALPLYKRALAIAEKAQGPKHPSTGTSLNNLAALHQAMGAYDKALLLFQRALAIAEKAQGPEHPSTGTSLNNLATLHQAMGAYDKALPLFQRALAIAEKAQGPEHPSTGTSLNNLAALHKFMGAYAKALPLYQRALAIAEKAQGPEHPSTGTHLNNLAGLHESMGAYDKALPLFQRALAIAEKALGPEHPSTGTWLNNLAGLHETMGAYDKALPLYQRAFGVAISRGGADPDLLALVAGNLCFLKQTTSRTVAIFYCKIAVNTRQKQRFATKAMSAELQHSFTKLVEGPYLLLNRLLTESKRYYEAELVLLALKNAELRDITRDQNRELVSLPLTPQEQEFQDQFNALGDKLGAINARLDAQEKAERIKDSQAPPPLSADEVSKLRQSKQILHQQLTTTLTKISQSLQNQEKEIAQVFALNDTKLKSLASAMSASPYGEANLVLAFGVEAKQTTVLVFAPSGITNLQISISKKELDSQIEAMRIGLQNKDDSWRAPATKLYQLLIAPLEAHFSKNKLQPQTLTLYLSDRLRLLPFAALLDGQGQFLTQKYRLSTYTAAAGDNAGKAPQQHWGITAFGSTLGSQRDKLPGLPAVKQELQAIVRTTATPQGIFARQTAARPGLHAQCLARHAGE